MITRRSLFGGLGALLAAPAIVRASSLMAIRPWQTPIEWRLDDRFALMSYDSITQTWNSATEFTSLSMNITDVETQPRKLIAAMYAS